MICAFNKSQLGPVMEKALDDFVLEIQKTQDEELTVSTSPGNFPYKLVLSAGNLVLRNLLWDHIGQAYKIDGDPLTVTKSAGDVKNWERPEPAQAPEQEIEVTVNNVVAQFMGLPVEKRPAFFSEVWKLINAEVSG